MYPRQHQHEAAFIPDRNEGRALSVNYPPATEVPDAAGR